MNIKDRTTRCANFSNLITSYDFNWSFNDTGELSELIVCRPPARSRDNAPKIIFQQELMVLVFLDLSSLLLLDKLLDFLNQNRTKLVKMRLTSSRTNVNFIKFTDESVSFGTAKSMHLDDGNLVLNKVKEINKHPFQHVKDHLVSNLITLYKTEKGLNNAS